MLSQARPSCHDLLFQICEEGERFTDLLFSKSILHMADCGGERSELFLTDV